MSCMHVDRVKRSNARISQYIFHKRGSIGASLQAHHLQKMTKDEAAIGASEILVRYAISHEWWMCCPEIVFDIKVMPRKHLPLWLQPSFWLSLDP